MVPNKNSVTFDTWLFSRSSERISVSEYEVNPAWPRRRKKLQKLFKQIFKNIQNKVWVSVSSVFLSFSRIVWPEVDRKCKKSGHFLYHSGLFIKISHDHEWTLIMCMWIPRFNLWYFEIISGLDLSDLRLLPWTWHKVNDMIRLSTHDGLRPWSPNIENYFTDHGKGHMAWSIGINRIYSWIIWLIIRASVNQKL